MNEYFHYLKLNFYRDIDIYKSNDIYGNLQYTLEFDMKKLFFINLDSIIIKKIHSNMMFFYTRLILYYKNMIILKRKGFIYLHKLMVIRNLLQDKAKELNIIMRGYLYKWYRMKNESLIRERNRRNRLIRLLNLRYNQKNTYFLKISKQLFIHYIKEIYKDNFEIKNKFLNIATVRFYIIINERINNEKSLFFNTLKNYICKKVFLINIEN